MRTGTISVMRALLRQEGYRLPSGSSARRCPRGSARLTLPEALATTLAPLRTDRETLTARDWRAIEARLADA